MYNATDIYKASQDAYSRNFYNDEDWMKIIEFLLGESVSPVGVLWVLFSKHMRWNDEHTFKDFKEYYSNDKNGIIIDSLNPVHQEDGFLIGYLEFSKNNQ